MHLTGFALTLPPVGCDSDRVLETHPCSGAQRRFWVLERLEPGNPALNVAVRWRIEGVLPTSHIERAFEIIIARHEVLRTVLLEHDGEPFQNVLAPAPLHVSSIDLTVLAEAEAEAECERIARAEARVPFELRQGPLIRVTHVRERADRATILVTAHHSVCDGWSIGLLAAEMGEICAALAASREPVLPALPVSFGEFARWERENATGAGLDYWTQTLRGAEHVAMLPSVPRPDPAEATSGIESLLLPRWLTDTLADFGREHGCTLFMTAFTALSVMLHRYTGAADVVVGTQVTGRDEVGLEHLVGVFINTLVLRVAVGDDPEIALLLARARNTVLGALEHQETPFEAVTHAVQPARSRGIPLFSVNFIFQRSFIQNRDYGSFRLIDLPSYSAGPLYDLNFFMVERPEGWRVSCEYRASLFAPAVVEQFLRHLVAVIREMPTHVGTRVSRLPMLDGAERQRLIFDVNATGRDYPRHKTMPDLIAEQARRTPERPALTAGAENLRYRELAARIDALAAHLSAQGFGPGTRIGIYLPRSADLAIAPLAVMRAGLTYVPLDPTYPAARIAQIVEQAELGAVIAASHDVPPALSHLPIVPPSAPGPASGFTPPTVDPASAAYVIFTSGSTGVPKGVAVPHRALTNFMVAMQREPGISAEDTLVAVTTLCFDIAALELFLPLVAGARVVIASVDETQDGWRLQEQLRASRATMLQATPSTWRLLIATGWRGEPQVRMLCGGEALTPELARALLARGPELWNMYGPTETTIWSAVARISSCQEGIPIGAPIANTQFYVVTATGELAPPGAAGELWIGGDGVALGYWNRPSQTADRFVSDPFRNVPGALVYRTGDLVQARLDGGLHFLGRADRQVKIRGYRIELGDVEAAILRHGMAREAVVVAANDGDSLLAYLVPVVARETWPSMLTSLSQNLAQALPAYLRPSALIPLEALPLLPNGKLDRAALPLPTAEGASAESPARRFADETEAKLYEIWSRVLGVPRIESSADFFDLGGHSLLAARMLAQVEVALGCRLSLAELLQHSRFGDFVIWLRANRQGGSRFPQILPLSTGQGPAKLLALSQVHVFRGLAGSLGADVPFLGLQTLHPGRPAETLPQTFEAIGREYATLVRHAQPAGPYVLIGWCNGGVIAFETARQLEQAGERVERVILVDTWRPGYLASLGSARRRLTDLSYRVQFVARAWAEAIRRKQGTWHFLRQRRTFFRLFGGRDPRPAADPADEWLVEFLTERLKRYRPGSIAAPLTILRSSSEPSGYLLDPHFGWSSYSNAGVDVHTIAGDHFSVFAEPGVSKMAEYVRAFVGGATLLPTDRQLLKTRPR